MGDSARAANYVELCGNLAARPLVDALAPLLAWKLPVAPVADVRRGRPEGKGSLLLRALAEALLDVRPEGFVPRHVYQYD